MSSKNGEKKMHALSCVPYIMPAGRIGICIGFMSWDKIFKIGIVSDQVICKDTKFLVE